jgi:RNA polymerase sigma factor (TIGR02999 family)
MSDITRVLSQIESGDQQASAELLPLVYDELRRLAASKMALESPDQTLQATALVHEAYLRLVAPQYADRWDSRGHFFAAAAEAMRRILVENARRKRAEKRGGDRRRVDLSRLDPAVPDADDELLALNEALDKLSKSDPRKAELVKLRFFAGLSHEEAAKSLGISPATAYNDWAYARAWLRLETSDEPPHDLP